MLTARGWDQQLSCALDTTRLGSSLRYCRGSWPPAPHVIVRGLAAQLLRDPSSSSPTLVCLPLSTFIHYHVWFESGGSPRQISTTWGKPLQNFFLRIALTRSANRAPKQNTQSITHRQNPHQQRPLSWTLLGVAPLLHFPSLHPNPLSCFGSFRVAPLARIQSWGGNPCTKLGGPNAHIFSAFTQTTKPDLQQPCYD